MLKLFALRERQHFQNLVRFVEANWEAMAKAGKCMVLEIKEERAKRSNAQNKYYRRVLNQMAEDGWVEGKRFTADAWHEYSKRRFIGTEDLPGGGQSGISTTTLNTKEFAEYVTRVEVFAAQELGITLTENIDHMGRVA